MIHQSVKRIHFIAVCGTAMGNLAVKMKQIGYSVTGSDDNFYPPMSTFLENNGIRVYDSFAEENIAYNPDLVIIGNAVVRGNPEAEYVLNNKLPYMSFPEALKEFFLRGNQNIVVTGTHGKTTTASLLAHLLTHAGRQPGFLIGGLPKNFDTGFQLGKGEQFVIEGDEYDSAFFDKRSKFIHYLPEIVILNNIEFDHADIFRDLEDIKTTFRHLIKIIPQKGLLIANSDDPVVTELIATSFTPVETFGRGENAAWKIHDIRNRENGVSFSLDHAGTRFGDFSLPLLGTHNVMNATGAIIVLHHLNLTNREIQDGLDTFKSIRRRLEIRGEVNGIVVYDDFAHHPTAIRETLSGLRQKFPQVRIWAIFEPRTNTTRRNLLQKEITSALETADGVVIGKINRPHLLKPEERLNREQICKTLQEKNRQTYFNDSVEKIIDWLAPQLKPGDQVAIMSNGSFDGIHEKLLARLRKLYAG